MVALAVFFDLGDTLVSEGEWRPGAQTCVAKLRDNGVRLGVLSNTGSLSRDELKQYLPGGFDFGQFDSSLVLLSSEVGVEKPKPAIFLRAIEAARLSPWDCVYVSENLAETWAAQWTGMQACRVQLFPDDFDTLADLLSATGP